MSDAPENQTGYLGLYEGDIEVGMSFFWEPNKPYAREVLTVVRIDTAGSDERKIWTCQNVWNNESRFREAVVYVAATPSAEVIRGMVKPLVWEEEEWWRHVAKPFPASLPNVAFWVLNSHSGWRSFGKPKGNFKTLEEAKAAVEEHNANTILAALGLTE